MTIFCPHCGKQINASTNPYAVAPNAANVTLTLTPATVNAAAANPLPIIYAQLAHERG